MNLKEYYPPFRLTMDMFNKFEAELSKYSYIWELSPATSFERKKQDLTIRVNRSNMEHIEHLSHNSPLILYGAVLPTGPVIPIQQYLDSLNDI